MAALFFHNLAFCFLGLFFGVNFRELECIFISDAQSETFLLAWLEFDSDVHF